MAEKKIRCVEIRGNRVKYLPESIARNPIRMRQIGFMVQEIEELPIEPEKPFPTPEPIVEPKAEQEEKPKQTRKRKTK